MDFRTEKAVTSASIEFIESDINSMGKGDNVTGVCENS